jgi:hypothetical protein
MPCSMGMMGRSLKTRWICDIILSINVISFLTLCSEAFADTPFVIARLKYGGGGDWYVSRTAIPNLLSEVGRRLGIEVSPREKVVTLQDKDLFEYPLLYITGHGNIKFTDSEARRLRRYLEGGGFLLVNDSYGLDKHFRREIKKVFPDKDLVEIPRDHEIYRAFYNLDGLPKIHEHDGLPAKGYGIFLKGRLVLFYAFSSDIGDGWESPEVHGDPPALRELAFRMGVNIVAYVLGGWRR